MTTLDGFAAKQQGKEVGVNYIVFCEQTSWQKPLSKKSYEDYKLRTLTPTPPPQKIQNHETFPGNNHCLNSIISANLYGVNYHLTTVLRTEQSLLTPINYTG